MQRLGCPGYVGDACGACGDGYALAGSLCQRTLESFQAQAALAGKPAELPPAPAPGPATSLGPKVPMASKICKCTFCLMLLLSQQALACWACSSPKMQRLPECSREGSLR